MHGQNHFKLFYPISPSCNKQQDPHQTTRFHII